MNDSKTTKPVGIMPNHLDLREITFTNLLLLDFNPAEMESKYRVVFNRDMFALPNKKAMEVIMHFLFTRLHPQLAYEEFRDCWPVRDKVMEQQFRKVCFTWVSRIQKEDPEARLPRIVQSLFHSPGGDRFYAFLHHFSLYVLTKVMHRDHVKMTSIPTFPTKTVHNHSFTHVMSRALEVHYIVLKKRFLEFTQHAVEVENHWKEFAMESTKEFRALTRKKRDLEKQVMELNGMIAPRGTTFGVKTDYQEEVEALKRTQELQKVRDLWAGIEEFYVVQAPHRRIVDSILQGEANKYEIDAADIQPRVPDMLLRDCERDIRKRNIQDTYIGGKVNLYSLLQLWNLSLSKIKEQICQEPLPTFEDQSPAVRSALHTHHAHLTNTIALREAIEGTIPAMKESIKEMKLHCYKNLEDQHSRPSEAPVLFKLGLVPPTPPVSFAAADTPAAERITSFNSTLRMSPDTVCTPDVIHAWTKSTRRKQTDELQELVMKPPKPKKAEPSRLPRPKLHSQLANQTRGSKGITSQSTQKKKKRPLTGSHTEKSIPYPHYVTPRTHEPKKEPEESSSVLKPRTILADQIADAVAMEETASSSLSSTATSSRASTPKPQALEDPVGALGQDAFQPRDLIPRTPAKTESEVTLPQLRTGTKPGLLLKTILDESTVTTTPSPAQGKHSSDPLPQADLSWSDIKFSPVSVKSPLLPESPPERGPLSMHLDTVLSHTDSKHSPVVATDEAFREQVSLNHCLSQPTPSSVRKSLFEDSPQPGENLRQGHQLGSSHPFTLETPESAKAPLAMGPSPRLDFWLLPQSGNLNHSGVNATPNVARTELFEGTPLENGNSPFAGLEFLNRTGVQFTTQTDKTKSEQRESQVHPLRFDLSNVFSPFATQATPLRSPFARHTTPEIRTVNSDHELDTTELAKRLHMIKQPNLQHDTWSLQPSWTSNQSETKHTPKSAETAQIEGTPSRRVNASGMFFDSSDKQLSPLSSLPTHVSGQVPHDGIPSDRRETAMTPSAAHPSHLTPKQATKEKKEEETFQSVSSSSNEVDTSALIQRLNKIKLTQQSLSTPHFTASRFFEAYVPNGLPRKENVGDSASDTSLLASRLDQIKQAQKSQQVTPGANTDGDLSTSRTSEPALLTPLTPSSGDTPSDDGTKQEVLNFSFNSPQQVTSFSDSPSCSVDRHFLLQWPFKSEEAFTTPPPASVDIGTDLGLVEGLQWETATPSLPQRLATRTGLASGEKSSVVPTISNGLRSPVFDNISPLLENSVQRPDQANWIPGSSRTPVNVSGFGEHGGQDEPPRLVLSSPFSNGRSAPGNLTSLWEDVPQSPLTGQLIDLE